MKPTLSLIRNTLAGKAPDHQPCKFGGKELDAMYGLHFHDFHARLQIPDLGRFDRPDPLADKYPHLSPYLFCANDPVNNTDPSGMEILFNGFTYTPGGDYTGEDDFIRRCVEAMNIVYESGGDKLIDDLVASESKYSFVPGLEGESFTKGENYGDTKTHLNVALDRNGFISAVAHESMHAGQYLNGQGGQSIFNEVEAYAFELSTALRSFDLEIPFKSGALSGGNKYTDSMRQLQFKFDREHFTNAMFLFKREANANNSGKYDSYSFMPNNWQLYHNNIKSILLKYSPW